MAWNFLSPPTDFAVCKWKSTIRSESRSRNSVPRLFPTLLRTERRTLRLIETMATKNLLKLKAHFDLVFKGFMEEFWYGNMTSIMGSLWGCIYNYVYYVFGLLIEFIFRSQANDLTEEYVCRVIPFHQDDQTVSKDSDIDGFREEETSISLLNRKYEFLSGKGFGGFLEGPKATNFSVQELYADSDDDNVGNDQTLGNEISADKDSETLDSEEEDVGYLKTEDSVESFSVAETLENTETESVSDHGPAANSLAKDDSVVMAESVPEDCLPEFCSGRESVCSNDTVTDEFLADKRTGEELESEPVLASDDEKVPDIQEIPSYSNVEEIPDCESLSGPRETVGRDHPHDSEEEYIELEPHLQNLRILETKRLSGGKFSEVENEREEGEEVVRAKSETGNTLQESEGTDLPEKPTESDSDYQDDLDFLWEHEDVIEQLKMELRNARTGGLPTIYEEEEEEPESPIMVRSLKLLKIDEKFEFKDRMAEVQKVYRSYAEKMKKLDMLNSRTMHSIGFLQLKDPVKSISMEKSTASAVKSLSHNIWTRKARRVMADPAQKFIVELQNDLELVYVGQVCLSWEMLLWQYRKAQELQDYDSQGSHRYNQVAGEFQLFQVLVQRFVENEAFQGPRVQNYVNHRCVLRSLLQVPVIRDDCSKDRKVRMEEEEEEGDAISSSKLAKIIEESMRLFWGFLRADKDEGNMILNGSLIHIRADLQKKEKKLKDILRSGNCIVRKFQKQQDEQLDVSLLLAQVELKLVLRVLTMSRLTTDQLVWCREKLDQINIISRKIHVEPSFLLFPC